MKSLEPFGGAYKWNSRSNFCFVKIRMKRLRDLKKIVKVTHIVRLYKGGDILINSRHPPIKICVYMHLCMSVLNFMFLLLGFGIDFYRVTLWRKWNLAFKFEIHILSWRRKVLTIKLYIQNL